MRTYDNIWKIATVLGDNYTNNRLSDYNYFKDSYNMIAIDLSKQQALDADPKVIQQIKYTGTLDGEANDDTTMFFIIEEAKEILLNFLQGTVRVLWMSSCDLVTAFSTIYFCFNIVSVQNNSIYHFKRKIV